MQTQNDMTAAKEILRHLGGRKFIAMTGARNFVGGENMLMFSLPRAKDGINKVRITLNSLDTYDLEFGRVCEADYKAISSLGGIYNEDLCYMVEHMTGLRTSL